MRIDAIELCARAAARIRAIGAPATHDTVVVVATGMLHAGHLSDETVRNMVLVLRHDPTCRAIERAIEESGATIGDATDDRSEWDRDARAHASSARGFDGVEYDAPEYRGEPIVDEAAAE